MRIDIADHWTARQIESAIARLPWEVKARLGAVVIRPAPAGYPNVADAGRSDIRIRLPLSSLKAHDILYHEAAHVYLGHFDRVRRGEITAAQAEVEAETLAQQWQRGRRL